MWGRALLAVPALMAAVAVLGGVLPGPVLPGSVAVASEEETAPSFVATGHAPTQGDPVPGGYLHADLGTWTDEDVAIEPDAQAYQWLRDGVPIPDATERDYLVQAEDVGHELAPVVTAFRGEQTAQFLGSGVIVRQLTSSVRLDARRLRLVPTKPRRVWMAVTDVATERPWTTDGGVVVVYKRTRHGALKEVRRAVVIRNAAFVRLPWKKAPRGRTKLVACFLGTEAVAQSCSAPATVRRR